ncbi:hypothetical protein STEG23_035708, partial [Scotinomys teguina]
LPLTLHDYFLSTIRWLHLLTQVKDFSISPPFLSPDAADQPSPLNVPRAVFLIWLVILERIPNGTLLDRDVQV